MVHSILPMQANLTWTGTKAVICALWVASVYLIMLVAILVVGTLWHHRQKPSACLGDLSSSIVEGLSCPSRQMDRQGTPVDMRNAEFNIFCNTCM